MRLTFSDLLATALEMTGNRGSTDAGLAASLTRFINARYQLVLAELNTYVTERTRTAQTLDGEQYYRYPLGVISLEGATVTVGGLTTPLEVINSLERWQWLNEVNAVTGRFPVYIFPRADDFGIYPVPSEALDLTFVMHERDRTLSVPDVTGGTVTLTQDSPDVVGTGTAFTSAMIGRWIEVNGVWVRIAEVASTTELALESTWEDVGVIGASYRIGQTPDLPEEAHILLPQGAAADWYGGERRDTEMASRFNNEFWTGDKTNVYRNPVNVYAGLIGLKKRTSDRSSSRIVRRRGRPRGSSTDILWSTVISDPTSP